MGLFDALSGRNVRWKSNATAALKSFKTAIRQYETALAAEHRFPVEQIVYVRSELLAYGIATFEGIQRSMKEELEPYKHRIMESAPQGILNLMSVLHAGHVAGFYKGDDHALALMLVGLEEVYNRPKPFSGRWYNVSTLDDEAIYRETKNAFAEQLGIAHNSIELFMDIYVLRSGINAMFKSYMTAPNWADIADREIDAAVRS